MSQETQILKWIKTNALSGMFFLSIDENNNPYLVNSSSILNSGYQGKCFTDTDPGTLTINEKGYWYFCGETGTFTNFDNLTCNKNDQLWWNGAAWDRIETGSVTSSAKTEAYATEGQTDFPLSVALTVDDLVQVNGKTLPASDYSGVGTTTLVFTTGLDFGDLVIVKP